MDHDEPLSGRRASAHGASESREIINMARKRDANQRYHDRIAGRYEAIYDDAYWQWHDALTWDYLKPHLPADLSSPVLDLGCGSGKWGRKLLKSGYRVTFVDLSHQMLDAARLQVAQSGGEDRALFVQADLVALAALPANHFGLAVAMGEPIGLAADPSLAMRQIARCLAPGGRLVATFDNRIACVDHYAERGESRELEQFLRNGRTRWLTRDAAERFEIHTFEPRQLRRLAEAGGFEVLEMLGKTVLPMRRYREQLAEPADRRRWAQIERRLARDPDNFARCAHLQIAARLNTPPSPDSEP